MTKVERNALIRAHQQNIYRYCRLLGTQLTDHEREYVHRRIAEEHRELDRLMKSATPIGDVPSKPPDSLNFEDRPA